LRGQRLPRRLGLPLALFLAAACTPPDTRSAPPAAVAAAIVAGTADSQDPAVVGIGSRRLACGARLAVHCSGVLIAPRLVLTAAHCVGEFSAASNLEVLFGSSAGDPAAVLGRVAAVQVHPDYHAEGDPADLALLILATSSPVPPLALNTTALDQSWVGRSVRLVGFGQTGPTADPPGQKRAGTARISELSDGRLRIVPGPSLSCHGDSGGPLLSAASGSELVIGIIATGDPGCAVYGLNARVDTSWGDFIAPWVARTATSAPPPIDGPLAAPGLCGAACASDSDCPAGLLCQVGPTEQGLAPRCLVPGLLAGALSTPCTSDAQCGERCVRLRADDGPAACRCYSACATEAPPPPPDSGCRAAAAGSASPSGLGLLLTTLLFTWLAVRRPQHRLPCPERFI
jgi:hypothetical protein